MAHRIHQLKAPLERLHLLCFPPVCRACHKLMTPLGPRHAGFPFLCAPCLEKLPWKAPERTCQRCGSLTAEEDRLRCPLCATRQVWPHRVWCAFYYTDPVRQWIWAIKYHREESMAAMLGRLLHHASLGGDPLAGMDWIAPVPLHPRRLRQRGFNQSLLLAHALLRERRTIAGSASPSPSPDSSPAPLPLLWPDLLQRIRHTRPQMDLPADERAANVAEAFALPPEHKPRVAGRTILLVDDLLTTGATLAACTQTLLDAGAARVEALVLGRA